MDTDIGKEKTSSPHSVGECTYGMRIRCKGCGWIGVVTDIIGEEPKCVCGSYNVEELFTHFYSAKGEVIHKTSVELVPIKAVWLDPKIAKVLSKG